MHNNNNNNNENNNTKINNNMIYVRVWVYVCFRFTDFFQFLVF